MTGSSVWRFFLPGCVVLMMSLVLCARQADAVVTRVKDVLTLDVQAKAGAVVKLRGVVTDVSAQGDEFSLSDGEAGVSVMVPGELETPELWSEVELEGAVFSEAFMERQRTRVKAGKLTVLKKVPMPAATPVVIKDVAEFKHLDQWVSVEGTVLQVRSSMSLFTIQLVAGGSACNVLVRNWPRDAVPNDWIGGRVRVVGVNRAHLPGSPFLSVVASSPEQVTVLEKGVVDPMDAPAATVAGLLKADRKGQRVKLKGTLVGITQGNVFYAREGDGGAFSFYMLHPIDEDKSGRFSTPIITPKCKVGDVVEVTGLQGDRGPGVHLHFGVVRVLGEGPEPAAITSDVAAVSDGRYVHDLVEVHGRLVSLDDVLVAPGRWRTTMRLDDAGKKIIAYLDAPVRSALAYLEPDQLLHVRAVVTGEPHFPEIRLWIRGPEDIQSLGIAKEVVTRRLWLGLAVAGVIATLLGGWALMLRRSRAAVSELNATLEARVSERTSELAAAKEDLARALVQERELSELKSRFVSLVSHEFRTPLGVTMSAVEVLRHYGKRITPEKHEELYEDIYSATLQMSGLMEQVLLLGKAEAGKLGWRPLQIDLPEFCSKIIEEVLQAHHHRCPVNFTTEGDLSSALMDEALVRHMVGNLLSNAVKYSPAGSPVDFNLSRDKEEVVLVVKDYGIGIPEADQGRLYEAFHRASNVGETPGTGLGLLLVKRCVELHQGSIEMHSKERVGTTFTVRLPLRREEASDQ